MGESINQEKSIERLIKNIKVDYMKIEDIPQVAEIFISYWGTMCLYHDTVFERIINQNISFVYKIQNEVVAFCLMEYNNIKDIVEVDLLCVKKEYRGYHLGKSILSFSINFCRGLNLKNFSLHVSTTNMPALNLYKKLGFVICGYNQKYYTDEKPEDSNAYFMKLCL